jgi:hypothetical protein
MLRIPVVGQYDSETKAKILGERGAFSFGAFNGHLSKYRLKDTKVLKIVLSIWPASKTYEITHSFNGERYGNPWYLPIDLGDDVFLSAVQFSDMCLVQFENENITVDGITQYLKDLTEKDTELYKLMVKMGKII